MPDQVVTPETPADRLEFIEEWLAQWLAGLPGVRAIVEDKVFPDAIPDDRLLPALIYTRRSTQRSGNQTGGDRLPEASFDVTCWVTGPTEKGKALRVAKAIRDPILATWLQGTKDRGQTISKATIENEFDVVSDPARGDDMAGVGRTLTLAIRYRE